MSKSLLEKWIQYADEQYQKELNTIQDESDIADRFYQTVPFGTGGMRGQLGAGINRLNIHTIRLVSKGLAKQIESQGEIAKTRGVVIAYDTRHFSQAFAYETAGVLALHGIQSYVFKESRPTPELSFAVRYLHAYAGVVITASHNPKQYNGFKVYGEDGAQLTPQFADEIVKYMDEVTDVFSIGSMAKKELLMSSYCTEILERIDDAYARALQTLKQKEAISKNLSIVYTPLHGAGLVPTLRAFEEAGFTKVHVVAEQAIQDGSFPTVDYPNPEEAAAFSLAIELGKKENAELLLATDPDADRLGVAVKSNNGYELLTGNQLGALLLQYLLQSKKNADTLPQNGVMVKTIVTSELGTEIAKSFGVKTINTLTGFKFIAEKMAEYELTGEYHYLFGYEESYGYLAGDFVRDKDAVQIALLTAEMAAYYNGIGKTLKEALNELYMEYGFYKEQLLSLTFEGMEGQKKISSIMESFRNNPPKELTGIKITRVEDYQVGQAILTNGNQEQLTLPKSNVLKFILEDGSWVCVRPSGTEPKCKFYVATVASDEEFAHQKVTAIKNEINNLVLQMN
ncbi:phospho-sugar mutase [Ureibacillus chungkukjangi]|uniref:phospho-sugar mutase n=1 Tax=Ureibacillus chungkukjangi TaxID=1202712 RepID=UPI00203E8D32|nr:phospho-sugar mutase [Ureibacillus chungkukjangi]MCM3389778.1 phospho-sugar mutase [Ureibacillus chungkukjangi]